jgi:hypothetical protein
MKTAANNRRKHRKQMRRDEITAVEKLVNSQGKWEIGPHAFISMAKKGVTEEQVLDVMRTGYVFEVNHNNDLCVAFRKEYGRFAVCVVVSLRTRWVVTAWKNSAKDKHRTLDMSQYKWGVDLTQEMAVFA